MSDRLQLQNTLHSLIPLSRAMGIEVAALEPERLQLTAPLRLNHNHAGSGFAGSIYSLASLAGWALLRHLVEQHRLSAELVLGEANIRYRRQLTGDLVATVRLPVSEQEVLVAKLRDGSKARLQLTIGLGDEADPDARFQGHYFARPAG
jgi:thioesterase domain-containing protein